MRPLVVVVAYHGAAALDTTLEPLAALDVLVVDNSGSAAVRDVTVRRDARYLDSGGNVGFAQGVNLGLARAGGRDVVLVNPDAVIDADSVALLVGRLYEDGRVAAASPRLRGYDGQPQRVLWPFPSPAGAWLQAVGLGRFHPRPHGFVVGAVLALRADAIAEVGRFDPGFFLYSEETDWQRRAHDLGWQVAVADDLVATHVGAGTSTDGDRRETHFHAGNERYIRKWFGRRGWASYRVAFWFGSAARAVVLRGTGRELARRRAALYRRGPRRCEESLAPAP